MQDVQAVVYFDKLAARQSPSVKFDVQGSFNSHYSSSKPVRLGVAVGSRRTHFGTADAVAASRLQTGVAV